MASSFIEAVPELRPGPRLTAALRRLDGLVDWERRARTPAHGPRMRVTVEPARDLLARLGDPQRAFAAVHVAGTKGKGSVAQLVAAGLERLGYRTGVYASPHVERVQERVRIGLAEIGEDALAAALEAALDAREDALAAASPGAAATWFDVLTAAAFRALAAAGVEVGVIECGLGGRLDSTNVLAAPVCVLTNVDLEHTALLGTTRAAIAREKAGIVTAGARVVTSLAPGDEAGDALAAAAAEAGATVRVVAWPPEASLAERNRALARAALEELEAASVLPDPRAPLAGGWSEALDAATAARARLPGRAERRQAGGVPVVLDGAHVASGLERVLADLEADPALAGRPSAVFGTGLEKDSRALLKALLPRVDSLVCTSVGDGPYRPAEELAALARELGGGAQARPDPHRALDEALRLAAPGGWVLVTGSLHLVGAVRRFTTEP